MSFQFHKGTIKTGCDVLPVHRPVHFNSIKVRLKRPDTEFSDDESI